jgi:predicted GNAT superfamily acetyltransferase
MKIGLKILDDPQDFRSVEDLQRQVWSGNETEIVPVHMLIAAAHNGGLVIGAFEEQAPGAEKLVGFVFGFPGFYITPDGPRLKHHSHMMGVLPEYRDLGIGFSLKRAQWQMVRQQGVDRITWTFDPLLSRNAHLNIAVLGAVCNTYLRSVYGELRDGINTGLPSDRFQVDWWVNSARVNRRLSRRARNQLDLLQYIAAESGKVNPTHPDPRGFRRPGGYALPVYAVEETSPAILLVEIPADFLALKAADPSLALEWRLHIRLVCEGLFERGYLVTDFVHLADPEPRSYYVFINGEKTL